MNENPKIGAKSFRELSENELEALAYSGELGQYFTIDETTRPVELPLWSVLTAACEPEQRSIPEQQDKTHRIGVAKGLFDIADERPLDHGWQSMPDVGLEIWPSYSADTTAWATAQARALRNHDVENLDWEHLADEILGVAKAEELELSSRVPHLMVSLIKTALGSAGARLIPTQPFFAKSNVVTAGGSWTRDV